MSFQYCTACGEQLTEASWKSDDLIVCTQCKHVTRKSAQAASCALLVSQDEVLLAKRRYPPSVGLWCLPGGYVRLGESAEEAVRREVEEELSLRVNDGHLFNVYSDIELDTVVTVYSFSVPKCNSIVLGEELLVAQWFKCFSIPWDSLAFPSTCQALSDLASIWLSSKLGCQANAASKPDTKSQSDSEKTICIDFDGVIADISQGYRGAGDFGKPLPGTEQALKKLHSLGWRIIVYTSRDEVAAIKDYMRRNDLPCDFVNADSSEPTRVGVKPLADIYLDDKALTFTGNWEKTIAQIESFRPWHQKQDSKIHNTTLPHCRT